MSEPKYLVDSGRTELPNPNYIRQYVRALIDEQPNGDVVTVRHAIGCVMKHYKGTINPNVVIPIIEECFK